MVDFTLPKVLSEEFLRQIPHQRAKVNKLFRDGKLVNYALSLDNSKIWATINANSELDVLQLVSQLPLTRFMQYKINLLFRGECGCTSFFDELIKAKRLDH
jgi:hypothetical protein